MHIALIADGNGRWGMRHFGERAKGHEEGAEALHRLIENMPSEVSHFTFYGLSIDNIKKRPKEELEWLYWVIQENLGKGLELAQRHNIRLGFIGNGGLTDELLSAMRRSELATQRNTGLIFTIALSYGGQEEIARAACVLQRRKEPITTQTLAGVLDTKNLPDVDLLIRTGGEKRLSGFLLWQCAYAELFFTDTLFPDFDVHELKRIIAEYHARERKFGGLGKGRSDAVAVT